MWGPNAISASMNRLMHSQPTEPVTFSIALQPQDLILSQPTEPAIFDEALRPSELILGQLAEAEWRPTMTNNK